MKYDRELWSQTVRAMKRIGEIKIKREAQFVRNRLKITKGPELERDLKVVEESVDLLAAPVVPKRMQRQKVAIKVARAEAEGAQN